MSVYATIDLNSLMSKLSNKELYNFYPANINFGEVTCRCEELKKKNKL